MSDDAPAESATPGPDLPKPIELAPALAPVPEAPKAKPGRKPAVPKVVDERPLNVRCKEAYDNLRGADGIIRAELRKIEACERELRDAHNRIVVARGAIRAREKGLEREAISIIQKQTGIRAIPGFKPPSQLSAWLIAKKETKAKLKAAEQEARMKLQVEPPPNP